MTAIFNLVSTLMGYWLLTPLPHIISKKEPSACISPYPSPGLFDVDDVLEIKISGNIKALFNDRAINAKYHPLSLTYKEADRDA